MEEAIEKPIDVRKISIKNGLYELEVAMTPEFVAVVRKQFMLNDEQPIEDDHINMFLCSAIDSALKKYEKP